MKVLFVYPQHYLFRGIPLGISLLSAILKKHSYDVDLFDTTFMRPEETNKSELNFDGYQYLKAPPLDDVDDRIINIKYEFRKKIQQYHPDLVAFSITTDLWKNTKELIDVIRHYTFGLPILVGGVHPTINPEEVIKHVDMICVGEGEKPILELCRKMENKDDITNIKGIWYNNGKTIFRNDIGNLIDLDTLPCPDWSLFDKRHLRGAYKGKIYNRGHYLSMKGCPYKCSYCTNFYFKQLFKGKGKYVRWESVDKTISNLKRLKEQYQLDMVKFSDDLFIARPLKEIETFAQQYKEHINIPFLISISPKMVDERKLKLLKDAGCIHTSIGIETGNYQIRKDILKRNVTDDEIRKTYNIVNKLEINTSSFNMIGLPTETREDVFKTIEMNRECQVGTANVYYIYPYPKTEIQEHCKIEQNIEATEAYRFNMSEISTRRLRGLKKTFILYMKFPKTFYPLIRLCEFNNPISNLITKRLFEYMQRRVIG